MSSWVDIFPLDWGAIGAISTIVIAILGARINRRLKASEERATQYSVLVEYRREILEFSSEFLALTAEAISESEKEPDGRDFGKIDATAAALSALLDKGRFIFPNYLSKLGHGKDKGPAFEGFRREPLDAIMATYLATRALKGGTQAADQLHNAHRELIRAQQPLSGDFDPTSPRSLVVEARRSFLNSVVPSTYPREWRKRIGELLGEGERLSEDELDARLDRHLKARRPEAAGR